MITTSDSSVWRSGMLNQLLGVPAAHLGDFLAAPHQEVEILAAPFWHTADRDLGRFHQQETQYRVSLFRDVAQSSSISTTSRAALIPDNWRSVSHTEIVLLFQ